MKNLPTKVKRTVTQAKLVPFGTIMVLGVIILGLGFLLWLRWSSNSGNTAPKLLDTVPVVISITPQQLYKNQGISKLSKKLNQDPAGGTVIARTQLNTSVWHVFEDREVGVRFKYPPEWGEPERTYVKDSGISGAFYTVKFPQSGFMVGGTSKNIEIGRGGWVFDFNGFSPGDNAHYWHTPEELCAYSDMVFCRKSANAVQVLASVWCGNENGPPDMFAGGPRLMLLNRPGKIISGLTFGGDYFWIPGTTAGECISDQKNAKALDQAVLNRMLDTDTMKNFDAFEKVFETVESF